MPFMYPKLKIESQGIEDPRIVRINGTFYMTYVAHNGKDAISVYASGQDLFNLKREHIISPKIYYRDFDRIVCHAKLKDEYYFFESYYQKYCGRNVLIWHKDCVLFPEKINGQFFMLHRILPDIQYISFDDFSELKDKYFWLFNLMHLDKHVILEPTYKFELRHLGAGCPPIKTKHGWLMIYHSAKETNKKRIYYAGATLLKLKNPGKVIARLPHPLFKPTKNYELKGTVNDVVFPTGTALFGDELYIYYGAADKRIAVAQISIKELINELLNNKE